MFEWLTDWYVHRLVAKERANLPAIDWRSLLGKVGEKLEGASVFLENRDERFVKAQDADSDSLDIVSLIVTWSRDGVQPWDTEGPAKNLAKALSDRADVSAVLLLSRSLESFLGYYVRIRPVMKS